MEADKTNRKVMTLSFVSAGTLAWIISRVLFDTLGGMFAPIERLRGMEVLHHGIPLAFAFATFFALSLNPKIRTWADEVISEIRKIVWPSQKDTVAQTMAVCVMVVVAGLGLSVIDYIASMMIKWVVN